MQCWGCNWQCKNLISSHVHVTSNWEPGLSVDGDGHDPRWFWPHDIRLQSECFVHSCTRSCASRSTASLGMSHQKRNQYLDGMPRCNIGKMFKSVCNKTFIVHEFVMHVNVTLEMLLFKVSYNRHAPKLLHLGALTFDRC